MMERQRVSEDGVLVLENLELGHRSNRILFGSRKTFMCSFTFSHCMHWGNILKIKFVVLDL